MIGILLCKVNIQITFLSNYKNFKPIYCKNYVCMLLFVSNVIELPIFMLLVVISVKSKCKVVL